MSLLDEIGSELTDDMPEVSQHAIDEQREQERKEHANPAEPAPTAAVAPNGQTFNPETHEISAKTGKVIKKRRGGQKSTVAQSKNVPTMQATAAPSGEAQARASGQFAAGATVALCVGVFGDEFQPVKNETKDEFAYLENAYSTYFLATGKTDIPPVMGLVIALGMYALPRVTQPKTRSKLSAVKDWALSKFLAWRGKKALKAAEEK